MTAQADMTLRARRPVESEKTWEFSIARHSDPSVIPDVERREDWDLSLGEVDAMFGVFCLL
jgi:hypothetical protein